MGISGGSSSSSPVDMTPKSFQGLQGPYAAVIGQLLGYQLNNPNGTAVNPVNFTYPAGQFASGTVGRTGAATGAGGTLAQIGAGQTPSGSNMYTSTGREFGSGGGSSNANTVANSGMPRNNGAGAAGSPGYYLSNPNLGTGNPNDILNGIPTYQGPLTADITGNEQGILGQLMANSGATGGGATDAATANFLRNLANGQYLQPDQGTAGLGAFNQGVQGAHATAAYDPNSENPFLQAAISAAQRTNLENLQETLTQSLPGRFTQSGQFVQPGGSSAFDRAAALATRGVANANADIATNLSYQTLNDQLARNFQANQAARAAEDTSMQAQLARQNTNEQGALNRQVQGAQITPQVTQAQVSNMVQNLQAQALPRLIQEYGIERGMDEFNNRVNSLLSVIGIAGGVTQPTVSQKSSSSQMGLNLK